MSDTETRDKIVREAKARFKRCQDWEATARKRWIEDVKFCNGDSDNLYQWPQTVRNARGWNTAKERPCLTVNKTRQHCLQIINDARQNKTSIKVKPVGEGASVEAAQVFEGIVRHIEYVSDADSAYGTATRHQVMGGMGYWRVTTDYAGPHTFDQEIYIKRVKDPLAVYVDPDYQEADGSDMRFAFVFEDMPKDEFDHQYGKYKDCATALGNEDGWIEEDHVRVCEYFRRVEVADRIIVITGPDGSEQPIKESEVPAELKDALDVTGPGIKARDISESRVEWFLIIGDKVAEKREWPGKYIPIVPVPGEVTEIDGELDRKGHARALKDPQRMYNYNASAQVEFGALQTKVPYIAAAEAIEGYEDYWRDANLESFSILPYKNRTDDGSDIPAPQRSQPPVHAPAFQVGMENAANDMMLVSGQYQADMGAPSNETSGVAIQQRQRRGDTATYHYIDNLARAVRYTGKIIIDLIPKIYDTPRIIKIMAEDGTDSDVQLDPKAAAAHQVMSKRMGDAAEQVVFNPNIGDFEVQSDVGPAFATRRQEAFNAFTQIAAQNHEIMPLIGDLMFRNADFPGAEEIAERLRRMVPPQALGDGPDPQVQQLQTQLNAMQGLIQNLSQQLSDKSAETAKKLADSQNDSYRAETDRLKVVAPAFDQQELATTVAQLVTQMMQTNIPQQQQQPQPMSGAA